MHNLCAKVVFPDEEGPAIRTILFFCFTIMFAISTIRFSYYGALSLIMIIAVEIPIIVISKIREKKATTHYEQNTK